MHPVSGGCHCGNISLDIELSNECASYHPRACDCDFCRKHGAAYISDPQGSLQLRIEDERQVGRYRQGNELADMILCTRCGVLIGALYRSESEGRLYATVNVRVISGLAKFAEERAVSPKKLSGDDKVARWKDLWFSRVTTTAVPAAECDLTRNVRVSER
jgi:hypothetical protein